MGVAVGVVSGLTNEILLPTPLIIVLPYRSLWDTIAISIIRKV